MKKIYTVLFLMLPLIGFSQWEQLGLTQNNAKHVALNGDGKTKVISTIATDSLGKTQKAVKVFIFNENSWEQVGQDIIIWKDHENFFAILDVLVDINKEGNIIAVKRHTNHYKVFHKIHQLYKFDGIKWNPLGEEISISRGTNSDIESDFNTQSIVDKYSIIKLSEPTSIRVHSFINDKWKQLGDTIKIEEKDIRTIAISEESSIIALGKSSTKVIEIHKFNGTDWVAYGNNIPLPGEDYYYQLKLNYKGNRLVYHAYRKLSSDEPDSFIVNYKYNTETKQWEKIGSIIKPVENSHINHVAIDDSGDFLAFNLNNTEQLFVYKYDGINWSQDGNPFSFNEGIGSINFDECGSTIAFSEKVAEDSYNLKVFSKATLNIKKQTFGEKFKITPNPSFGETTITLGAIYKTANVIINDVSGKQIDTFTYSNINKLKLNTNYQPGLYFVTITSQDKIATLKLVVK